jgi:hypothetical protein
MLSTDINNKIIKQNLNESMISNFEYHAPKDPEELLYDFYFIVSCLSGVKVDEKYEQYALDEALKDCVNHLDLYMKKALLWCLSAELRHINSYLRSERTDFKKLKPQSKKFLSNYLKRIELGSNIFIKKLEPQRYSKEHGRYSGVLRPEQKAALSNEERPAEYKVSYEALKYVQHKMKLDASEVAECLIDCFDPEIIGWYGSFGGSNWKSIAEGLLKLINAKTINEKIIYLDHAYDLQHNTGSVFTKLKSYYKHGAFSWLKSALDWKRDVTDLRDFYFKVSYTLKPIVAWIIYNKTGKTIEDISLEKNELEHKEQSKKQKEKLKSLGILINKDNKDYTDFTWLYKEDNIPVFEVGKYYKFNGNPAVTKDNRKLGWNNNMRTVLDGKPYQCIEVSKNYPFFFDDYKNTNVRANLKFSDEDLPAYYWYKAPFVLEECTREGLDLSSSQYSNEYLGTVQFKKDKKYKWIGPTTNEVDNNYFIGWEPEMIKVASNNNDIFTCIKPSDSTGFNLTAGFSEINNGQLYTWYGSQYYFVECDSEGIPKPKLKFYDNFSKKNKLPKPYPDITTLFQNKIKKELEFNNSKPNLIKDKATFNNTKVGDILILVYPNNRYEIDRDSFYTVLSLEKKQVRIQNNSTKNIVTYPWSVGSQIVFCHYNDKSKKIDYNDYKSIPIFEADNYYYFNGVGSYTTYSLPPHWSKDMAFMLDMKHHKCISVSSEYSINGAPLEATFENNEGKAIGPKIWFSSEFILNKVNEINTDC